MDNKIKILVIIMFFVFIGGIIFDASSRLNKMSKKPQDVAQNAQIAPEQMQSASLTPEQLDAQRDTSEETFNAMASNAQNSVAQTQPSEEPEMEIIGPQTPQELSNIKKEQPQISGNEITMIFPELGIEQKSSQIQSSFKTSDIQKNEYFYFPPNDKMKPNSMGLLIKVSPMRALIWQKELFGTFASEPGIAQIAYNMRSLRVNIENNGAPMIFAENGDIVTNPFPLRLTFNNGSTNKYKLDILNNFTHKGQKYLVTAYANLADKNAASLSTQEFFVYRASGNAFVKQYRIYDRPYSNRPLPIFTIQDEVANVLFLANTPATPNNKSFFVDVRIPSEKLSPNFRVMGGLSPASFTQGVEIEKSQYKYSRSAD